VVFCPSDRQSCDYYGYKYPYTGEKVGEFEGLNSLFPSTTRRNPSNVPADYYPQQSRDYALSNTVKCACSVCPANKNGYCETPALIEITAGGKCKTGMMFLKEGVDRDPDTFTVKKDAHTPDWFFNRWYINCPICTTDELVELRTVDTNEKWVEDVVRVNLERKK
jgi:hypothetical protein